MSLKKYSNSFNIMSKDYESISSSFEDNSVAFEDVEGKTTSSESAPGSHSAKQKRRHSSFSLFAKGIIPTNYPTLVSLELASIHLDADSSISRIAFCYRQERQIRLADPQVSSAVKFDLTFHSLLFDVIKINILKPGFFGQSHVTDGQAVLQLSEVDYIDGEYTLSLPIVAYKDKQKKIGTIKLHCHFYNFVREKDPKRISSFLQAGNSRIPLQRSSSVPLQLGSSKPLIQDKQRESLLLHPLLELEEADFEKSFRQRKVSSGSSMSLNKNMEPLDQDDYMDIYESYGSISPLENQRMSVAESASSTGNSEDSNEMDNTFSSYIPSTQSMFPFASPSPSNSETQTLVDSKEVQQRKKVQRSKSLDSLSYSPPPSFQSGLNKNLDLVYGFIATGWKQQSPLDLPKAFGLLGRYYKKYSPEQRTGDIVQDLQQLEEAEYFMNFMLPSYGGLPRWFFGNGGLIEGLFKPNRTITMEHLFIAPNHMLEWHYGSKKVKGLFATTPSFFICFDKITHSIHLHCRGTFNIQDVLTDVNAEYIPFLGGVAHGGILNAAVYIRDHYLAKIMGWIKEFEATSFIITGHSLGAAVASIFTMMVRDKVVDEMNAYYNLKTTSQVESTSLGEEGGFKCVAFTFACPPCVSADIIEPFHPFLSAYVNQHDIVPKLSYGAAMDLKALLQQAGKLSSMKNLSESQKLERLDQAHRELTISNKHPRLVIPGQIYFMYKREKRSRKEKSCYVVERSSFEHFDHFHLKYDMVWHHLPQKYDNSLKKAIAELDRVELNKSSN